MKSQILPHHPAKVFGIGAGCAEELSDEDRREIRDLFGRNTRDTGSDRRSLRIGDSPKFAESQLTQRLVVDGH